MQDYQRNFIQLAIKHNCLRFGEFTLKSKRISPYFFNAGLFNSGATISALGNYYAEAIIAAGIEFDMLFGPAYKGIPLAVTTAIALSQQHQLDYPLAFNRKEPKDHGEGGIIIGAPLAKRVLIVDDVMTSGLTMGDSIQLIKEAGATPVGVIISVDRQERGQNTLSAAQEVQQRYALPVFSIVKLQHIMEYVKNDDTTAKVHAAIEAYFKQYGA
ncbi:orotate phosphoribosyltransferase [soil metagenome]